MRNAHRFRPSASWVLEDRLALSVASPSGMVAEAIPQHGLKASFQGKFTTFLPSGVGGSENSHLVSRPSLPLVGRVRAAGDFHSNASLPPPYSNTQGTFTFISRSHPGVLTLNLTGPPSELAPSHPTTTHYTFKVVNATGDFKVAQGALGTADLTLKTHHPRGGFFPPNIARGNFIIRLSESSSPA